MARLLLGVSGGIAAYKALELARLATLAGHGVRVVMTDAATHFVGTATFQALSGQPVATNAWDQNCAAGIYIYTLNAISLNMASTALPARAGGKLAVTAQTLNEIELIKFCQLRDDLWQIPAKWQVQARRRDLPRPASRPRPPFAGRSNRKGFGGTAPPVAASNPAASRPPSTS